MQIDDAMILLRRYYQLISNSGDTLLSIVKLNEIKFRANGVSHFHAFAGGKGAVGVRP